MLQKLHVVAGQPLDLAKRGLTIREALVGIAADGPVRHFADGLHHGVIFGSAELNGFYETNGDHELFVSPGVQYVTTRWILEATVQIPVWQDLKHRAERDFIVGIGFRVQF